jgi:4-amino-4-deoxy-L-arabinose transferase-like glycosyltransferase
MTPIPYLRLVAWGMVALFLMIAAVVAVAFPIHASDALTFGTWSRLISEHWHFNQPQTGPSAYSRPLFYALQGWLWGVIGYSDVSGRLLCGLFSLLLVAALAWAVSARPWGRLAAAVIGLLVVATPVFAYQVVSTLTDVFVAAFIALTGALLFRPLRALWRQSLSLGSAATLAVLAKPSAIPALVGLGLAQLLVRGPLRRRVLWRIVPLAAGGILGFLYYVVQAAHLNIGLRTFLEAGVRSPYYSHLADQTRRYEILNAGWFGNTLRSLLLFTLLYTAVRLAGVVHRNAVVAIVPGVALFSWLLPWLANHEGSVTVGAFANPSSVTAWLLTCAVLAAAVWAPQEAVPRRLDDLCNLRRTAAVRGVAGTTRVDGSLRGAWHRGLDARPLSRCRARARGRADTRRGGEHLQHRRSPAVGLGPVASYCRCEAVRPRYDPPHRLACAQSRTGCRSAADGADRQAALA